MGKILQKKLNISKSIKDRNENTKKKYTPCPKKAEYFDGWMVSIAQDL